MKGFKRIKIEDSNNLNQEDTKELFQCNIENNILKISAIIFGLVISLLILTFFLLHKKSSNKEKTFIMNLINQINQTIDINQENLANEQENIQTTVKENLKKKYELLTEEIQKFERTLRKIKDEEIKEFRRVNNLGILLDETKYKRSEEPEITVVTTLYNQAHCIKKAIRSVQNQSLKNIEIIIVDDCSLDNSTETVEELMKDDERIILLEHKDINKGVMITRNEAIRVARGKYITILDPDDTFLHKDILSYSLHVAKMADLDVVEFWSAYYTNEVFNGYYHLHGYYPIIYQPELRTKFIDIKNNADEKSRPIRCRTVWGKIVKNEIFQKTLDNIPSRYLNDYILGFEDTMITVSLYQVAQTYYCLRQPGYYYTFDERRNRYPLTKNKTCYKKNETLTDIDHVKYMQFLEDKLDNNRLGKQTLFYEIRAINNWTYSNFKRTITHHFDWVYSIIDKLIGNSYITEQQREKLRQIKRDIKENENKKK